MTDIKLRQFERMALIAFSLLGLICSFDFGLILTAYPHGGQLVGIPFAIALILYSCFIIFSNSQSVRQIFRIINYTYISSMVLYIVTIKIIEHIKGDGENAWEYLNSSNEELSRNEKIFNAYAITGLLICLILISIRWIKIKGNGIYKQNRTDMNSI